MTSFTINDVTVGDIVTLAKGYLFLSGPVRSRSESGTQIEVGPAGFVDVGPREWRIISIIRDGTHIAPATEATSALDGLDDDDYVVASDDSRTIVAGRVASLAIKSSGEESLHVDSDLCGNYRDDTRLRARRISRDQLAALLDPPAPEYRTWGENELAELPPGTLLLDTTGTHTLRTVDHPAAWIDECGASWTNEELDSMRFALVYQPDPDTMVDGQPESKS